MIKRTRGEKIFAVFNVIFLCLIGLACLIPIWHCLCASISDPIAVAKTRGLILWPKDGVTMIGYTKSLQNESLLRGYVNTILYVILGTGFGVLMSIFAGYGLSRHLLFGGAIALFLTFTMMFNGGIIPTYMVIRSLGMLDTRAAIVLPTALSVFNIMITRTSFKSIPEGLMDAARIDGAGHIRILVSVVIEIVLQNTSQASDAGEATSELNQLHAIIRYCVIMLSIIPMLFLYPFIQKYFVTGVMIGSIKG